MNRSMSQPEIARGRYLWLIITVALGLALSSQAAAAKECQRETPLPADVHLIAPGMEVPESMARFAGVWIGEWERTDGFCQTLVVEEVFANGFARVIYSHGASLALNVSLPGFWRATGRIVDGTLRFHEPIPERPEFAYRVAGETLEGTLQGKGHVRLTRMADVDQVGCGPQAGGLPPAPPAAGPRDRLSAAKLAEALYKTTAMGLPSREENRFGEGRYQLSFWSVPYRTANGCVFQIPYMAGLGGNLVVLLPNGVSAFRLADGHDYSVDTMVLAGEAIRPFPCPAEPRAPLSPARQPLTASDLHAELAGHTLYRDPFNIFPGVLGGPPHHLSSGRRRSVWHVQTRA